MEVGYRAIISHVIAVQTLFFNNGDTQAVLNRAGNTPSSKHSEARCAVSEANTSTHDFKTDVGMLSNKTAIRLHPQDLNTQRRSIENLPAAAVVPRQRAADAQRAAGWPASPMPAGDIADTARSCRPHTFTTFTSTTFTSINL